MVTTNCWTRLSSKETMDFFGACINWIFHHCILVSGSCCLPLGTWVKGSDLQMIMGIPQIMSSVLPLWCRPQLYTPIFVKSKISLFDWCSRHTQECFTHTSILWVGENGAPEVKYRPLVSNTCLLSHLETCVKLVKGTWSPMNLAWPTSKPQGNLENTLTKNRIESKSVLTLTLKGKHLNPLGTTSSQKEWKKKTKQINRSINHYATVATLYHGLCRKQGIIVLVNGHKQELLLVSR